MPPAIIGGVIAGVGALGAAAIGSSASNSAAQAQQESNAAAIAEQRRRYDQTRTDLQPWQQAGQHALGQQGDLLGLNGNDKQQAAIQQLQHGSLYQSLYNNGRDTLLANASATGGLRGGNTQGALANFGRDTLSSVIENHLGQLGGLSQTGQNSAAQVGAYGQNNANSIGQLLSQSGSAQVSGILGGAGAQIAGLNSAAGSLATLFSKSGGLGRYGSLTSGLNTGSGYFPGPLAPVSVGNIDVGTVAPF
jgi:hypothetical protein